MENYTEKLIETYAISTDKDENFVHCLMTLDSWRLDERLSPLLKYFTITDDNRVAILLKDIDAYKTLNEYQQKEFLNLLELIVKSKYDRNETDAKMPLEERIALFYLVALKEESILKYLQRHFPEYNFAFGGENINDVNEHHYLFSGYGRYSPDITSNIGPSVCSELKIEIKPRKALENEQDYAADLIIRYSGNKAIVEEPFDFYETFKGQELSADDPQDNKKLMCIRLVEALKDGFEF